MEYITTRFSKSLYNNACKPIRILLVAVHRILTVLNMCEGFGEWSPKIN